MESVLISIQPKWCELIASGKKTVEVRKTRPKIDTPFKVPIYCTQGETLLKTINNSLFVDNSYQDGENLYGLYEKVNSKVIGEFVCDNIDKVSWFRTPNDPRWVNYFYEEKCLTSNELYKYSGGKDFYEWHISDLVIYDKPKELGEFKIVGCKGCRDKDTYHCKFHCIGERRIKRPPQSWCYAERR